MNEITKTIISQLGGNKFMAMTGTKEINCTSNAVHFKFGSGAKNKANHCSITLKTNDTYQIEFHRVVAFNPKYIGTFSGVYASGLTEVFSRETGFRVNL